MNKYLEAALAGDAVGLSMFPPKQDGSKKPDAITWTAYHTPDPETGEIKRETPETLRSMYTNGRSGVGAFMGRVSNDVELFEFDDHATYGEFLPAAEEAGLADLVARIRNGYEEETPRGGIHWLIRCAETSGNTKLAQRPAPTEDNPKGVKVLIETRGNGGYAVLAPSNGRVHELRKPYRLLHGGFDTIAEITPEERRELWTLAQTFDEMPNAESKEKRDSKADSTPGERPGDIFNQRTTWADVLEPDGWTFVFERKGIG